MEKADWEQTKIPDAFEERGKAELEAEDFAPGFIFRAVISKAALNRVLYFIHLDSFIWSLTLPLSETTLLRARVQNKLCF